MPRRICYERLLLVEIIFIFITRYTFSCFRKSSAFVFVILCLCKACFIVVSLILLVEIVNKDIATDEGRN